MSADSPRRPQVTSHRTCIVGTIGGCGGSGGGGNNIMSVPATVPPQVVSDRSIIDSAIGFISDVTYAAHQPHTDPKDTISWARFESAADISDPRYGDDWELEGNVAPPLLLILGYGMGVQVWAIPANGEAVEVLSWRHGIVTTLRVLPTPTTTPYVELHERADESVDIFADKRPLIALVDSNATTGSGGSGSGSNAQAQFCAVNFVSLKTGMQVKTIKFKNPVVDILANRNSIVITFNERIAVFDARSLEDRLSITTCYPSPGINPNPVALGTRWMAYSEQKLLHSKRSGGGCDGDGVASYTATVLNAAKSFGKGLRELGEQVAAGLTGTITSGGASKSSSFDSGTGSEGKQAGIVTILDIKHAIKEYSPTSGAPVSCHAGSDPVVAHFIAHTDALVAMEFDNSGMLLLTADRRGHDFHVFRIQPHPVGSSLAAVHHLYVLHRGDTSSKVQNITFSLDSRWVAVSTLRGTTHVFPITPYGGPMGVRTHTSLHVVNKLSRFHRSAGLTADGRSSSPISYSDSSMFSQSLQPYYNPTLPPFPRPTVVLPLAQLRQPFALGSPPGSAGLVGVGVGVGKTVVGVASGSSSQRQRLSSLSDDSGKPLSVCAIFAKSRSWLLEPPNATREAPHRLQRKSVDSLFVMAGHGALIQYDLDTKLASNVAKEKICDDTPIELDVEPKAQWNLGRRREGSQEVMPPLSLDNWLIKNRNSCTLTDSTRQFDDIDDRADSWLSQVEIVTHAGPHRRLWMGPQFVFKTYNTPSGSNLNHVDVEAVEIGVAKSNSVSTGVTRVERSSPLNMPLGAAGRSSVPVLIESGSYSSIEQSPKLMDRFRHDHLDSDFAVSHGDSRLKEDLADAMRESPSVSATHKESGRCLAPPIPDAALTSDNVPFYDALAEHDDDDQSFDHLHRPSASTVAALASVLPNIYSPYETCSQQPSSIEKYVNPLGTVTTITAGMNTGVNTDILDEVVSQLAAEDTIIHENCDEALFRPVVAIFCDEKTRQRAAEDEESRSKSELCKPPELVGNKLIVPVIAKEVDDEMSKREKAKLSEKNRQKFIINEQKDEMKFAEMSFLNKKPQTEMVNLTGVTKKKSEQILKTEKTETEVKPIEFKRMTPLPADKSSSVDKKETTKKAKNSAQEQTDALTATTLLNNKPKVNIKNIKAPLSTEELNKEKANKIGMELIIEVDNKNSVVESEHLNICDLADSLIEHKTVEIENKSADIADEKLLETVDIYAEKEKQEQIQKEEDLTKTNEENLEQKLVQSEIKNEEKSIEVKSKPEVAVGKEIEELKKPVKVKKTDFKDENKIENAKKSENKRKEQKKNVNVGEDYHVIVIECDNEKDTKQSNTKKNLDVLQVKKYDDKSKEEFKINVVETEMETVQINHNNKKLNKEKESKTTNNSPISEKKQQNSQKNDSKGVENKSVKIAAKQITQQPVKIKNALSTCSLAETNDNKAVINSVWKNLCPNITNNSVEKTATDFPIISKSKISTESTQHIKKLKIPIIANGLDDFPMLKPLEALPPLPVLEPLELISSPNEDKSIARKTHILPNPSLINFESPSQESIGLAQKITPPPRGFSDQNLIFAHCGSLHFENETSDKTELYSPTLSLTRSSSVLGEQSTAEYKSLTENDEQYISLEFSSQDTNTTTNTTNTNEKFTSSSNASSASEEVVTLEEKKMSKRQKRKLQKSKKEAAAIAMKNSTIADEDIDEELYPLIDNMGSYGLSDSQADSAGEHFVSTVERVPLSAARQTASNTTTTNTTTDSEGPLPATTSDDNVFMLPSGVVSPVSTTPHKIKTKKVKHKINLLAAIEAAMLSSASSAEESGIEASEERRQSLEVDGAALISLPSNVNTLPLFSLPAVITPVPTISWVTANGISNSGTNDGAKKKTRRRKR